MVDRKANIKQYSGCADSIPCSSDEEVRRFRPVSDGVLFMC